jgi:hypothetical protein
MEWIPKLYDTLDSIAFELRARWLGYHGQSLRNLALLALVIALSAVSPMFRIFVIATIASFMLAEIASSAFHKAPRRRRSLATR